jgi:hypothetical protein
MSGGAIGAAGASGAAGAAAEAARIQAIKASGAIVKLEARELARLLQRQENPLVVCAEGGVFTTRYHYITSYRGLAFYAKSSEPLRLPEDAEIVRAKRVGVPF